MMQLRYNSHASISLSTDSTRLITDPWFYEPIYGGMMWQYPRTKLDIHDYIDHDFSIITHVHPDHFCEKSIAHFDKLRTKFVIPKLESCDIIEKHLAKNGFEVIRVADKKSVICNDLKVYFYYSSNKVDTAQVIENVNTGEAVYNMNDCFLDEAVLEEIGKNHCINHAMIFYGNRSVSRIV